MKNLKALFSSDNDRFYYFGREKIFLKKLRNKIFITFKKPISNADLPSVLRNLIRQDNILNLDKTLSMSHSNSLTKHLFVDLNTEGMASIIEYSLNFETDLIASISEVFEDNEGKNLLALTNQLFLKLKGNLDETALEILLAQSGVINREKIQDQLYHLTIKNNNEIDALDLSNKLSEFDGVEYSNPDFFRSVAHNYVPSDPLYPNQWYIPQINADWAWGSYTGNSTNIGIMDIGIDISHPDLASQVYASFDQTGQPLGADKHGTLCAGAALAIGNTLGGIGVAFSSKLCQLRIGYNPTTDPDNTSFYSLDSWVVNAFNFARLNFVNVVSCSFGLGSPTGATESAINSYITSTAAPGLATGGVVVAATGNSNAESINYPASSNLVFAIGASGLSKERASFSNYGEKLLCVVPGINVTATVPGGFYTSYFTGTSAAAPIAAAIVAMIVESDFTLTRDQIFNKFVTGCDFIESIHGTPTGFGPRNKFVGYGIINLKNIF